MMGMISPSALGMMPRASISDGRQRRHDAETAVMHRASGPVQGGLTGREGRPRRGAPSLEKEGLIFFEFLRQIAAQDFPENRLSEPRRHGMLAALSGIFRCP